MRGLNRTKHCPPSCNQSAKAYIPGNPQNRTLVCATLTSARQDSGPAQMGLSELRFCYAFLQTQRKAAILAVTGIWLRDAHVTNAGLSSRRMLPRGCARAASLEWD